MTIPITGLLHSAQMLVDRAWTLVPPAFRGPLDAKATAYAAAQCAHAVVNSYAPSPDLCETAPALAKGAMPFIFWKAGASASQMREVIDVAWPGYHLALTTGTTPDEFVRLFRDAEFGLPAGLPDQITVWRGTNGVPLEVARAGRSWSRSRDAACCFAFNARGNAAFGEPLLLRRHVRRSQILLWATNKAREVVIDAEPAGHVDGDQEDWIEAAENFLPGASTAAVTFKLAPMKQLGSHAGSTQGGVRGDRRLGFASAVAV